MNKVLTWYVAEDSEQDIDDKVPSKTTLQEDTDWRQDDRKNDFENVTAGNWHL